MSVQEKYQRTVLDYLRTGYDVDDARIVSGGSHHKLTFTNPHNGARCTITLQNTGTKLGRQAMQMKLQDIRRLLGPPRPEANGDKRRTLAMMTTEMNAATRANMMLTAPPASDSATGIGRVTIFPSDRRVRFVLPPTIAAAFAARRPEGGAGGCATTRTGDGAWEIRHDPKRNRPTLRSSRKCVEISAIPSLAAGLAPFASAPAEFVLVDDVILVQMIDPPLRLPKIEVKVDPPKAKPKSAHVDKMRRALEIIHDVEAATPYRLRRREGGGWFFSAPRVEL